MITSDFTSLLIWWLMFLFLGVVNLPLAFVFFKKFRDAGYIFAKVIGMILFSYPIWLLGSLKILPFGLTAVIFSILLMLLVNGFLLQKNKRLIENLPLKLIILEEFIFLIGFLFWSYVRATNPEIKGLEKFMDFGFVNSILRTKFFPPADMWMPPLPINYYYFGHLITAVLTTLTGLDSAITYNLMLSTLFAFTFTGTFSLTFNLFYFFLKSKAEFPSMRLPLLAGIVSAFLSTMGGNLHTIIYVLRNGWEKYWYPDATRYIPYTIHEFPMYSFVVSDLHGHVLDIPTVLLMLSLILALMITKNKWVLPFLGLSLGVSFMTNAWNLPIYLLITGLTILWTHAYKKGLNKEILMKTAGNFSVVFTISIISALPFHLAFKQIAKGVALVETHSAFYQLLVLWGFPLFISFSFLYFLFGKNIPILFNKERLMIIIANLCGVKIQIIKDKGKEYFNKTNLVDGFVLILLAVSWLLIIMPEIFYVKDIYIKEYHRANTMFKFVYQSFMMFAIASGYIFVRMVSANKKFFSFFFIIYSLMFTSVMIYPYFSIRSYYNSLKEYKGLNGVNYLKNQFPADYKTIIWLNKNIVGQPVILEAVGESYTDYSRISANTGIPTVLGWPVHEWLWRGSYDEAGKRTGEVQRMYESTSISEVKDLLTKYKVEYVVVGDLERQKYKSIQEENFPKLGQIIFDAGTTKVYKIN